MFCITFFLTNCVLAATALGDCNSLLQQSPAGAVCCCTSTGIRGLCFFALYGDTPPPPGVSPPRPVLEPLPRATVTIIQKSFFWTTTSRVQADKNGRFQICVSPGLYEIKVADFQMSGPTVVEVTSGSFTEVEIHLGSCLGLNSGEIRVKR
jgi:hypothetical protein